MKSTRQVSAAVALIISFAVGCQTVAALDLVKLNRRTNDDITTRYSLREQIDRDPLNVSAFESPEVFKTNTPVPLVSSEKFLAKLRERLKGSINNAEHLKSRDTPKGSGTACEKGIKIFSDNDVLKVNLVGGVWSIDLTLQAFKSPQGTRPAHVTKKMLPIKHDGRYVGLMSELVPTGDGSPSDDPEMYDYYVMLRDEPSGTSVNDPIDKIYRIEAFAASTWSLTKPSRSPCELERPDIDVNYSSNLVRREPVAESGSGEGGEPK